MINRLNKLKNLILIILFVEIFMFIGLYIFSSSIITGAMAIYVLLRNMAAIGIFVYVFQMLVSNNIEISEIVDKNTDNIMIFGGVGLISYDENRNISWTSDLFEELDVHLIGTKVLEWQPQLASLFEEDDIKTIDIASRKYEVYHNMLSKLFYLRDVTDYSNLLQDYEDQQICMAYITIDNYDESIERSDEQTVASIQTLSRQTLLDWALENGIILRRYKSDCYIAIFNERIYQKQAEQHFPILDEFKQKAEQLDVFMSLSIGIGIESKILRELDEMAFEAASLCYSRGGDQVAVKSLSDDTRFFGGHSENLEKSNRVRARVISQSVGNLINKARNVIIMGHKQSDFDSLGASIAMHAMCRSLGKESHILVDFDSMEEKTLAVARSMKDGDYSDIFIQAMQVSELCDDETLLIVVDNHKPTLAIDRAIFTYVTNVIVIDHHRRGQEFIDLPILAYLEPSASSTVELIVELYEYQRETIQLTELEATVLYTGMLVDTGNFKNRVGPRTFEMAAVLREMQADVREANKYLEDDYQTTVDKLEITRTAYLYGEAVLIAYGQVDKIRPRTLLAKVGNELISIAGIKAVFVVGHTDKNQVSISARSVGDVNVQVIMEKLGGGGHFSMAACQIENTTIREVIGKVEGAIEVYREERDKL